MTEIYDCSRVPADERDAMRGGRIWIDAMTQTLVLLEAAVTRSR